MKKAQIHFTETIFVLLILIVLIFIGVVMTFLFFNRSLSEKEETITTIDAITFTDTIINMPEFTCGTTSNCIDSLKIFAFQETLTDEKTQYYGKLFGKKRITLRIIYPETRDPDKQCIYTDIDYPAGCGWFLLYGDDNPPEFAKKLETPAQVYFPELDKKVLGLLVIEVFE